MDFQIEKRLVQEFYKSIEMSNPQNIPSVLKKYCSETLIWRGFHPFNMIRGPEEVGKKFWHPLLKSLKKCQRREDIFFAGFKDIYEWQNSIIFRAFMKLQSKSISEVTDQVIQ